MLTDEQMVEFEAAEVGVRKAEAAYLACPTDTAGTEGYSLLTAHHLAVCQLNALRWRHGSAAVAEVRHLRAELEKAKLDARLADEDACGKASELNELERRVWDVAASYGLPPMSKREWPVLCGAYTVDCLFAEVMAVFADRKDKEIERLRADLAAERERCAKIADDLAASRRGEWSDAAVATVGAARRIAAAIREGKPS